MIRNVMIRDLTVISSVSKFNRKDGKQSSEANKIQVKYASTGDNRI